MMINEEEEVEDNTNICRAGGLVAFTACVHHKSWNRTAVTQRDYRASDIETVKLNGLFILFSSFWRARFPPNILIPV
jgi:hypothetical protein